MKELHHWAATGYDPLDRFPKGLNIFFDYDAPQYVVQLTLQHLLGYMPSIADAFPFGCVVPDATLDEQSGLWTLNKPLEVQTQGMQKVVFPAGTVVRRTMHFELLFSPATT